MQGEETRGGSDLGAQERTPAPDLRIGARSPRGRAARVATGATRRPSLAATTILRRARGARSAQALDGRSRPARAGRRILLLLTETGRDRAARRVTRSRHRDRRRQSESVPENGHVRGLRASRKSLARAAVRSVAVQIRPRRRGARARARAPRRTRDLAGRNRARMTVGRDDRGKRRRAPVSARVRRVGRRRKRTVPFSPGCSPRPDARAVTAKVSRSELGLWSIAGELYIYHPVDCTSRCWSRPSPCQLGRRE